jgi:hypothetical protein
MLSRQALVAIAQVLESIQWQGREMLLFKHLGQSVEGNRSLEDLFREVRDSPEPAVHGLVVELVENADSVSKRATTRYVYHESLRDLVRWLKHDGLAVSNGRLSEIAPAADETTELREYMLDSLSASGVDSDGAIARCLKQSSASFNADPANFNDAATQVRIALETLVRRAASTLAARRSVQYPDDSWGKALELLRRLDLLNTNEEKALASIYTLLSPGAHLPTGISDEQWARLARTWGLSAMYFVLRRVSA